VAGNKKKEGMIAAFLNTLRFKHLDDATNIDNLDKK
jgi:hypothetical protein